MMMKRNARLRIQSKQEAHCSGGGFTSSTSNEDLQALKRSTQTFHAHLGE